MPLTAKQRRFIAEYLTDQNAKQAAIRAGYSKRSAENIGSRHLKNPEVKMQIDGRLTKVEEKAEVDAAWVLTRLKEIAERCMQSTPVMDFDSELRQKVQATTINGRGNEVGLWEFDSSGANRALELIGKHLRMFSDLHELTGKGGAPLVPPAKRIDFTQWTKDELLRVADFKNGNGHPH